MSHAGETRVGCHRTQGGFTATAWSPSPDVAPPLDVPGQRCPPDSGEPLRPSTTGPVKTVRSNAGDAERAPDHAIVFPDTQDVYEQVLMFWDKVGAAYVGTY
jgi:hypothetical protein